MLEAGRKCLKLVEIGFVVIKSKFTIINQILISVFHLPEGLFYGISQKNHNFAIN